MNSTVGMKMLRDHSAKVGGDAASVPMLSRGQARDPAVQDQKVGISSGPILILEWCRGGEGRRTGRTGCSNTATATGIIGTVGTAGTVGADIDTGPDAGCIDFASRSASAATFG
jgi:hypothetical protein